MRDIGSSVSVQIAKLDVVIYITLSTRLKDWKWWTQSASKNVVTWIALNYFFYRKVDLFEELWIGEDRTCCLFRYDWPLLLKQKYHKNNGWIDWTQEVALRFFAVLCCSWVSGLWFSFSFSTFRSYFRRCDKLTKVCARGDHCTWRGRRDVAYSYVRCEAFRLITPVVNDLMCAPNSCDHNFIHDIFSCRRSCCGSGLL